MAKRTKKGSDHVVESAYFHTGNSGMTIAVREQTGDDPDVALSYRLDFTHGAFGAYTNVNVPLGCDHMVDWMIEALTRVRERMTEKKFETEYAFEHARRATPDDYAKVIDGLRREARYKEFIADRYSSKRVLIGYDWFDHKNELVIRTQFENPEVRGECGGTTGSDPIYDEEDIGKEIVNLGAVD